MINSITDSLNKGNHQIYHEKAIMLLFCLSLWLNKKIRTCGQSCKTLTHRNLQFVKIETSLYHASRVIIYYRKLFTRLATGLGTFLIPNVYITRYLCWKGSYEWFLSFLPCPVPPLMYDLCTSAHCLSVTQWFGHRNSWPQRTKDSKWNKKDFLKV